MILCSCRVWSKSSLLLMKSADNSNEKFLQAEINKLKADLDASRAATAAATAAAEAAIAAAAAAIAAAAAARAELWSNPYALMLDPIPSVTDISSKAASSSKAISRVDIQVVKEASNFKAVQKAYILSIKSDFEKRKDVKRYFISDRTVASEEDISATLNVIIFEVLNALVPEVKSGSARLAGISVKADAASFIIKTKETVVLYELKPENLIFDSVDMVELCQRDVGQDLPKRAAEALDALQQLVGYMIEQKCRFAILTSYQYFWAVELRENGDVLVSPAYASSDSGENSVMSMLCYIIHIACDTVQNGKKFTPPSIPRLTIKDPTPGVSNNTKEEKLGDSIAHSGTKDASINDTSDHWDWHPKDGFGVLRFLVDQADRITLQVRLRDGRLAAVKAFDSAKDRNAEVNCYRTLEKLQAMGSIPRLLNGDLVLDWPDPDERRVHALVMEWVGPPDIGGGNFDPPPLPDDALARVRETLGEMHEYGVAHSDVRRSNVMYESSTGRVAIFDFGFSCTRAELHERDFAVRCEQDLRMVDLL